MAAHPMEENAVVAVPRRPRLEYLDGVRALAAVYVVIHHVWITTWPDYPRNTGPWLLGWMLYGHLAVSVFIVLSGFSLAIAPSRKGWTLSGGWRTFLRRRAWRILPTYWAALALSCLVFGVITGSTTGDKVSAKSAVVHALLVQDVINTPKPNGAFWSIAVEWQIYFLFPIFLLVRRRFGATVLVGASAAGVVAAYLVATSWEPASRLLNLTPQFALLFVFGVMGAGVLARPLGRRLDRLCGLASLALAAAVVILALTQGSVWVDREYFWIDLMAGLATTALLAWLASHRPHRLRSVLGGRILGGMGRFSYSMYCIHLPVLWLLWHFGVALVPGSDLTRFAVLLCVGLPVVIVTSWLFSLVFERPFLTHRSFSALWRLVSRRRSVLPESA